jgi:hypothetical protein
MVRGVVTFMELVKDVKVALVTPDKEAEAAAGADYGVLMNTQKKLKMVGLMLM